MKRTAKRSRKKDRVTARPKPATRSSRGGPPQVSQPSLRVIGIGGSAGGIAPCAELLAAIPPGSPLAVIVVMHLSPTHESGLPGLLSRSTAMPVQEAREGQIVALGHVYVIPPQSALVVRDGTLHLEPRSSRREPPSVIDRLFTSLAESYGDHAVGVVLSGTGADGTMGLKAIKSHGGRSFAQDRETAQQDGMPASAIAQGVVDQVLSPPAIGRALGAAPAAAGAPAGAAPELPDGDAEPAATVGQPSTMESIVCALATATGVNFAHYKRPTLERRITHRMQELRLRDPERYLAHLKADPGEALSLYRTVLIQVTEFFRDPAALTRLRRLVLGPLLHGRRAGDPLRVWVAGCATGEEAYSLAIEALECAAEVDSAAGVQLFATDLSEPALAMARSGRYPATIASRVSSERLARFFRPADGGYEVQKRLRGACVFARHDLTRDPPFSRLDLVTCRNVLIYLDPQLQQRVLRTFHYALKPEGYLLLGPAETATPARGLFVVRDRKHRIYVPSGVPRELPLVGLLASAGHLRQSASDSAVRARPRDRGSVVDLERIAEQIYRIEHPSARVIVSEGLDILHLQGATAEYLEEPAGEPTTRLLKRVRPDLRIILGRLVRHAQKHGLRARQAGVRFTGAARVRAVDLTVFPLSSTDPAGCCLIVFEPHPMDAPGSSRRPHSRVPRRSRAGMRELEQELRDTREYLESVIDLQETTQMEMQAAYEESVSSNEEFRSTNEELETTKEELQSMNEEVTSLNEELQQRIAELGRMITDLTNIFESMDTPLVMLDRELRIRRFSPQAGRAFGLEPGDIGHSLQEQRWRLLSPDVVELCHRVIREQAPSEREVVDQVGHGCFLRVAPYRAADGAIEGVVLALIDVDTLHQLLRLSRVARQHSDAIIETVTQPLLVLDENALIRRANQSFYRTFQVAADAVEGRLIYDVMTRDWDFPAFRGLVALAGDVTREIEVVREFHGLGERVVRLSAHRMIEPGRTEPSVLLVLDDVTERRRMETHVQQVARADALGTMAVGVAHDLNNQLTALMGCVAMLESSGETVQERVRDLADVRRSAEHMAGTTQQLLAYGRRQYLQPMPLEMSAVIAGAANLLRRALGSTVQLSIQPSKGALWFEADPIQMEHVLLNLAFNARDAMPTGGRLELSAAPITIDDDAEHYGALGVARGAYVRLTVTDTGTGMDESTRARVFEPFFTTKDVGRGTGLGLASVYGVVKQSGGWIWVESTPGVGTRFTLDFPLRAAPIQVPVAPGAGPAPAGATGESILVVDDDGPVVRTTARQLRTLGYQVLEAEDGAAGLALLAAHAGPVDLLLSDVVMPGMSGPELAHRALQLRPEISILYMSGHPRELLVGQGEINAGHAMLNKPFTREALGAAVGAMLAARPTQRKS